MQTLDGRDRQIVQLIARFKQLSSKQLHEILFNEVSHTACDRALRRLTEQKYLARIERRTVGGARGGSGQYAYQLGRRGFYMSYTGNYNPARVVNYHSIAIGSCFIQLLRLHRAGMIKIIGYSTEPDCHTEIGRVLLKPDMYVEIGKPTGERLKLWFEVDMGTEAQRQLRAKLDAYWRAWHDYSEADAVAWPVFPRVLWVAKDDERAKELNWLIDQPSHKYVAISDEREMPLFNVTALDEMPSYFS